MAEQEYGKLQASSQAHYEEEEKQSDIVEAKEEAQDDVSADNEFELDELAEIEAFKASIKKKRGLGG